MQKQIEKGKWKVQLGMAFKLDEIVDVHLTIEENRAGREMVLLM
jgi:hypothetical protein